MTAFINAITAIVGSLTVGNTAGSGALSWVQSFTSAIVAQPLLLFFIVFGFVGTGIGLVRRIIRLN